MRASSRDDYTENETAISYTNMEFDDFDAQSEQLSDHGQLRPGVDEGGASFSSQSCRGEAGVTAVPPSERRQLPFAC